MILFISVASLFGKLIIVTRHSLSFLTDDALLLHSSSQLEKAVITRVIDGDTVEVNLGGKIEKIRLIGVDTPETVHPRKPVEYMGKAASTFTKKLLQPGDNVLLTFDWNPRDGYGRLLAYIWYKVTTNDAKQFYTMHNFVLIVNGFGKAYTTFSFREDYIQLFLKAQTVARENSYGLWGKWDEQLLIKEIARGNSPWLKEPPKREEKVVKVKIIYISFAGKDEYVVIKNVGNVSVNLSGWKLYSEGGQWYIFPSIVLKPGERISVHSGPLASGGLIWAKKYVWNNKGDKAILYDAYGNIVDVYSY